MGRILIGLSTRGVMSMVIIALANSPLANAQPAEEHCDVLVSVGDNLRALGWQPVDSPAAIDAMFEVASKTYNARRIYWRGERSWHRDFKVGKEHPLHYDYHKRWAHHLFEEVKIDDLAIAAAHRYGMEIYFYTALFDHGPQPDVGILAPYLFEDRLRIEHPEWCPVDRWGERRQPGPIDFCHPEARKALVSRYVTDLTNYGYDGICFYTYTENFGFRYPDETGFNEPIVREFKRRYGVDIRTEQFDKEAWYKLRGEYLTQFFRELHGALAAKGKKLSISLWPENPHFPRPWYATFAAKPGGVSGAGQIYMDWERWVREGIIDELIANWFGDQKALLRQMLKVCEGKQVELAVASVLAGQGNPRAFHPFGESVEDWKPLVQAGVTPILQIAYTCPFMIDRVTLDPTSLDTLTNRDWRLRTQTLADIAAGKIQADASKVAPLATDTHVLVRRQAMLALGALKAADHVRVLEEALTDPEPSVRVAAAQALAQVNGPETARCILEALLKDDHDQMRQACVKALAAMKERSQPVLIEGLESHSVWVREVCVRSLGMNGLPESRDSLLSALQNDEDYRVRYWAIKGLDRYKGPRVILALLHALDDATPTVQLAAGKSLGQRVSQMSPAESRRALAALEARFREYGDGCQRSDAAFGWRVVGNALMAFGQPGTDILEAMRTQKEDRWLAWAAYQVVHVPQVKKVVLCEEKDAVETHTKYAPPFPGWRKW